MIMIEVMFMLFTVILTMQNIKTDLRMIMMMMGITAYASIIKLAIRTEIKANIVLIIIYIEPVKDNKIFIPQYSINLPCKSRKKAR